MKLFFFSQYQLNREGNSDRMSKHGPLEHAWAPLREWDLS